MGIDICANCTGGEGNIEILTNHEQKPIDLAQPAVVISDYCINKGSDIDKNDQSTTGIEVEMSQKFWNMVKNQIEYGDNPCIKEIEATYGPFMFDPSLLDDTPKIVVGPLLLDNGATYYGHW